MSHEYLENKTKYTTDSRPGLSIITGTVTAVNINSFTVNVTAGEDKVFNSIPIINTVGTYFHQDIIWLKSLLGTTVCLVWLVDRYYVLGILPIEHAVSEKQLGYPVTDQECGGQDSDSYGNLGYKNFKARRANDFYDADKVLRSDNGGELSLLREGLVRLKAGPLSQFILGRFKEFGRLITRVFKHFTDFGEVEHYHTSEGRVSHHSKGGACYEEEAHPNVAKWTFWEWRGDFPDDPNARWRVEVNDKEQTQYVYLTYDIKGDAHLETSRDNNREIGRDENQEIAENKTTEIGKNLTEEIGAEKNITVGGATNHESGSPHSITAPTIYLN